MENSQGIALVATLVILILYPLFMRIISNVAQPHRLRMASVGRDLLVSSHLNERHKEAVDSMLDSAYDWRVMMSASIGLPIYVFGRIFGLIKSETDLPPIQDDKTRKSFEYFVSLHMRAATVANPFFAAVLAVEMAILVLILIPLGMAFRFSDIVYSVFISAERRLHGLWRYHHS